MSDGSRAVAAGILLSRIAGLVRERVLAQALGVGIGAEAFRAALRIPNLLQNLLGEGVLSASFVPTYARALADGRDEDAGRLAGAVASLLVLVTGLLVLVGVLLAEPLTRLLTPGFVPGSPRFTLTVALVRIVTPGLGLLVLSAWCLGVLNAHRRFFLAYVAPVLWNGAIIVAAIVAGTLGAATVDVARAVAVGASTGAVLQFVVQVPTVVRLSRGLAPRWPRRTVAGLTEVLRASWGAIAGRGVVQLSAYLDLVIASVLATGAVAALGYAQALYLLPISLFGMSVAAAALPDLATRTATDPQAAAERLARAVGRVAYLVGAAAVVAVVLGDLVVGVVLQGGRFDPLVTRQVALVLAAYGLGMGATAVSRVLQAALYGADDTVTPARVALVRVLTSTAVGVAAMLVLDAYAVVPGGIERVAAFGPADVAARSTLESTLRLGAVGLALGASVGAWVELALLRRRVRGRLGRVPLGAHVRAPLLAGLALVPVALALRGVAGTITAATGAGPLIVGPPALLVAGLAHVLLGRALAVPEAAQVLRVLKRRPRQPPAP